MRETISSVDGDGIEFCAWARGNNSPIVLTIRQIIVLAFLLSGRNQRQMLRFHLERIFSQLRFDLVLDLAPLDDVLAGASDLAKTRYQGPQSMEISLPDHLARRLVLKIGCTLLDFLKESLRICKLCCLHPS